VALRPEQGPTATLRGGAMAGITYLALRSTSLRTENTGRERMAWRAHPARRWDRKMTGRRRLARGGGRWRQSFDGGGARRLRLLQKDGMGAVRCKGLVFIARRRRYTWKERRFAADLIHRIGERERKAAFGRRKKKGKGKETLESKVKQIIFYLQNPVA
jgi:hypothetical protein